VTPRLRYSDHGAEVWHGDAREVAAMQAPGSFSLAILDGPYAMQKAAWDRMKVSGLPDWYAPHLDDVDRLCAPSASLYVWNTGEGWAALHPSIVARGWTFRALVTWDKGLGFMAGKCDLNGLRTWYDVTEVCGFYQREEWVEMDLWNERGEAHPVRRYLDDARAASGLSHRDVDRLLGVSDMARHWFSWSQWCVPSAARYEELRALMPALQRPWESLKAEAAALWSAHRAEYEASRPAFTCPEGVSNVWKHGQVAGQERLRDERKQTLHPCQKPLKFAERMVLASSRPGDAVWAPFGGTCREALATQRINQRDRESRRRCVTAEIDQDGRNYLDAVVRVLEGRGVKPEDPKQPGLFGTTPADGGTGEGRG